MCAIGLPEDRRTIVDKLQQMSADALLRYRHVTRQEYEYYRDRKEHLKQKREATLRFMEQKIKECDICLDELGMKLDIIEEFVLDEHPIDNGSAFIYDDSCPFEEAFKDEDVPF